MRIRERRSPRDVCDFSKSAQRNNAIGAYPTMRVLVDMLCALTYVGKKMGPRRSEAHCEKR